MVSVLFVCLGNICRSPMAEAVLRHYVKQKGLEKEIHIDSAGTGNWHVGEPPHIGTRQKLEEVGISYEGLKARQVNQHDMTRFDYIIGMDDDNIEILRRLAAKDQNNIYRFVDFLPNTQYSEVPDPYYSGDFEETYRLISEGCQNLLKQIIQDHKLKVVY